MTELRLDLRLDRGVCYDKQDGAGNAITEKPTGAHILFVRPCGVCAELYTSLGKQVMGTVATFELHPNCDSRREYLSLDAPREPERGSEKELAWLIKRYITKHPSQPLIVFVSTAFSKSDAPPVAILTGTDLIINLFGDKEILMAYAGGLLNFIGYSHNQTDQQGFEKMGNVTNRVGF